MKYGNLTLGQIEALVNKLGGMNILEAVLRDEKKLTVEDIVPEPALPTTMTVGGRTYDILSFHKEGEKYVRGDVMVARAKELGAHQGKEEREHLLKHQADIPAALRGKVAFVFTDDRHPDDPEGVCYVCWRGGRWVEDWRWLGNGWNDYYRVLRRK